MSFCLRLCYKSQFFCRFLEEAAALFKEFKVSSLGTKSHKAESRKNLVVLDNTIDIDGIAIHPYQDL